MMLITLTKEGACYKLGVHIADVGYTEHSALDVEALKREHWVLLVDRVIPRYCRTSFPMAYVH